MELSVLQKSGNSFENNVFICLQDNYLSERTLQRRSVIGCGACLFRCFSVRLYGDESRHLDRLSL